MVKKTQKKRKRKRKGNDLQPSTKRTLMEEQPENAPEIVPEKQTKTVWAPGMQMEEGEKLIADLSAYTSYFQLDVKWPFLSFDFIRDSLGGYRNSYPHTFYMVGGTQAAENNENELCLMKVTDLHAQPDEEDVVFGDKEEISDPLIESISFRHPGVCNRVKVMPQNRNVIASWSELGRVYMWNCEEFNKALDKPLAKKPTDLKPLYTHKGHKKEGFSMSWHSKREGWFLSGDCQKFIHLWEPRESSWNVGKPFTGHMGSVEDLAWSPSEGTVFSSCGVDGTLRVWDTRQPQRKNVLSVVAHEADVNVLSWNALTENLIATGSDDCSFKVWDLRTFGGNSPAPLARFEWHKGPITSIEFHPHQASTLVVAGEDDQITFWDLSLEEDDEEEVEGAELQDLKVPPQLLFVHQGQNEMKEVHFHPQIPSLCVSTAMDSLNLFQPDNIQEQFAVPEDNEEEVKAASEMQTEI